jgi:ferric-dicitrate binding protein FerR (iron transport regulator)
MEPNKMIKDVNTDHAWKVVHQRLQDDGLIPVDSRDTEMAARPGWLAYAAALTLLLAVGTMIYFMIFNIPSSSELLTLQTSGEDNTFVQTFEDGSVIYLSSNSLLHYPEVFKGGERKVSFSGEAFFDVAKKNDQPFVIETRHAFIEVLGTSFNLKASDTDFELIVEEGSVKVTLNEVTGQSEIIGQWEMLTGAGNQMEKSPVVDRTYLSWRMNRMQFRDEKLGNIVMVISKNYNIDIHFDNDTFRDRRMSVTFDNNEIGTIAQVIAASQDMEFEILPGSGIFFRTKE